MAGTFVTAYHVTSEGVTVDFNCLGLIDAINLTKTLGFSEITYDGQTDHVPFTGRLYSRYNRGMIRGTERLFA
jgi:hypothetical protein